MFCFGGFGGIWVGMGKLGIDIIEDCVDVWDIEDGVFGMGSNFWFEGFFLGCG